MKSRTLVAIGVIGALAAGCGAMVAREGDVTVKALALMKSSFREQGQAKLTRLDQDEVQRLCSEVTAEKSLAKEIAERIEKSQFALIKYPADGYMGDWKSGERIAQSGVGWQFSDNPATPSGANCYACHQLTRQELSFGTIGPPLLNFGKVRGFTPEMQKYAYGKIYNSQAFSACSNMPRFGHMGILTEQQMKDVVALLMDPQSAVNK